MLRSILLAFGCFTSLACACDEPGHDHPLWAAYEAAWMRSDHESRGKLERSQEAWLDYRDATCEIISARPGGLPADAADAHVRCLVFMARERAAELEMIERFALPEADAGDDGAEGCGDAP